MLLLMLLLMLQTPRNKSGGWMDGSSSSTVLPPHEKLHRLEQHYCTVMCCTVQSSPITKLTLPNLLMAARQPLLLGHVSLGTYRAGRIPDMNHPFGPIAHQQFVVGTTIKHGNAPSFGTVVLVVYLNA
jgi:hypothetical protein